MLRRAIVSILRLAFRLTKRWQRLLGRKRTVYVGERVAEYRKIWSDAAEAQGVSFVELAPAFWELRDPSGMTVGRLHNHVASIDDPVTLDIAGDKVLTYRLFESAGLTVTDYSAFSLDTLDRVDQLVSRYPTPFVIKPARNTSSGLGVTTNLSGRAACLKAAALALIYCDEALIERQDAGESYRLLMLGNRMICASRRTGLRVHGDGRRTLGSLLSATHGSRNDWKRDPDVRTTLRLQSLDFDTVPAAGAAVLVRSTGDEPGTGGPELRTVYTEDVTETVCAAIVAEARAASLALGSEFCGVDIITPDPSLPLARGGGVVSEINTTPGLHHHYFADSAAREPIAAQVIAHLRRRAEGLRR